MRRQVVIHSLLLILVVFLCSCASRGKRSTPLGELSDWQKADLTRSDLYRLAQSIAFYEVDNNSYPPMREPFQGTYTYLLATLIPASKEFANYRLTPPVDAWGNPYWYSDLSHREFVVLSSGADGKVDFSNDLLKSILNIGDPRTEYASYRHSPCLEDDIIFLGLTPVQCPGYDARRCRP